MKRRQAERRLFHYTYKTTCLITGRYYLGMHSTDDLCDPYLGSGTVLSRSIKKYGHDAHQIEILKLFPNRKALVEGEKNLITETELADSQCMNLMKGGHAAVNLPGLSTGEKISIANTGKKFPNRKSPDRHPKGMLGKKHTEEWKRAASERLRGKHQPASFSEKMKAWHANMTPEQRAERNAKISAVQLGKKRSTPAWNKGIKMPKHLITYGRKHSDESKAKNAAAHVGRKWCYDPTTRQARLTYDVPEGWTVGRP